MYVRLAFAVAAHMEPDILVVDEVLAVGDAEFQKKCLGKMRAAVEEGRTVLFVSHSMAAIKGLCTRALLLEDGALIDDGPVDRVVDAYLTRASSASGHQSIPPDARRIGTGEGRIRQVSLLDLGDRPVSDVYFADPLRIAVLIDVQQAFRDGFLEIGIASRDGIRIATAFSIDRGAEQVRLDAGVFRWVADLDVALTPGAYTVAIGLHHRTGGTTIDTLDRTVDFTVLDVSRAPGERHEFTRLRGFIRPRHRFHAPEQVHAVTVPIGDTHH
jgi:lipopolysaccharide transport system ATP-binding protein